MTASTGKPIAPARSAAQDGRAEDVGSVVATRTGDDAAADDLVVESLGRRVARTRHAAELTLAAVAQRADVSAAYISQIESATANPTVRSLARIAAAMGVSVGELFGSSGGDQLPTPGFEPRFATAPRAALAPGVGGIWDLTAAGSSRIFARLVHGEAGDHADPISHPGEEFVAVLAGRCHLRVGDRVRELKVFDACHFAASDPHHITDVSDDLLLLVILTEE